MVESEKHISPIEWDRNSEEFTMEEPGQGHNNEIKEIQRICTQSSPQLDTNYRLPGKIKYLFQETRYFMIKSNNFENVSLAKVRNVWSTTRANEIRLNKVFYETRNVLLIFSVKESGKFQGYARLATASNPKKHINWVLPSHMSQRQLSGVFLIDWLSREEVSFSKTNHLVNAWNEHKPVKIGRDGQEIEPSCGEFLCRLFPIDEDCSFNEIIEKAKCGPPDYRGNHYPNNNNNAMALVTAVVTNTDDRSPDNYEIKLSTNIYGDYGSSSYDDDYRHRSRSRSKRKTEACSKLSRTTDHHSYCDTSSDVFLNGNYEDYLREQTNLNLLYNQYSINKYGNKDRERYEQRVDDFLRNIIKRDPVTKNHDCSSNYSKSSSSGSYRRKKGRSRSYEDRRSNRSHKGHSKRHRSGSRHRR